MKKILVILIGILFVGIGIYIFISESSKVKRCTEETIGTVVEIKEEVTSESGEDDKYTYYPIIRYQAGNRTITKQSGSGFSSTSRRSIGSVSISHGNSKYSVNDKIDIMYNPNDVEEFIIKGDKSSNYIGVIFIILGALVAILGIVKPVN